MIITRSVQQQKIANEWCLMRESTDDVMLVLSLVLPIAGKWRVPVETFDVSHPLRPLRTTTYYSKVHVKNLFDDFSRSFETAYKTRASRAITAAQVCRTWKDAYYRNVMPKRPVIIDLTLDD
jgi:hypothetical protein